MFAKKGETSDRIPG